MSNVMCESQEECTYKRLIVAGDTRLHLLDSKSCENVHMCVRYVVGENGTHIYP